jgi:type IV secretory pathway VirB2 component (pilin)
MFSNLRSKKGLAILGVALLIAAVVVTSPDLAYADLEGSIRNVKSQLSGVFLPLLSVIGLLIASFSFLTGNPNSKQHITYALIGAAVGFGAQSIIDFITSTVH